MIVACFLLWSLVPASFAVGAIYSTKMLSTFLMAPAPNNFYLFDLYALGLILPVMMYFEWKSRKRPRAT
jgi:hypothetical protein